MQRTEVRLISKAVNKKVLLKGWIHELRNLAKIKFIILRDSTGTVQCVIKDGSKVWDKFKDLTLESVVEVIGVVNKAVVKSNEVDLKDVEVEIQDLTLLNKAERLPIQVIDKDITTGLSKRLDYRSLDLRKKKIQAIFKIQSEISNSFREFFRKNNFIEIQCPSIIGSASEGGTDLFEVKYFEKKAYLAQSPQLYKQLAAISLEKVFTTTPVWRAEKHNTTRHLNESRQMDIEVAFANDFDVMKYLEESVAFIVSQVIKNCSNELKALDLKLKVPKAKYLSYEEAIKIVKSKNGEDFTPENEKKLCDAYPDTIVFTHSWPINLKPFYILPKDNKLSYGFDALYGGIEVSSGGQRVHIPEILIKQLKDNGLNPKNFENYIDAFRKGAPEHSGWSIGLERFTMALLKLDNIREACIWPRDRERITP